MIAAIRARIDPFVAALVATVTLASLLPCRGAGATTFGWIADAGIVLLFFLHGAKLSRDAIVHGARNWRVHVAVLAASFVLFPLLGLASTHLLALPAEIATGLLYLTLLPSTVQSSVALTAVARGNTAAAICSASLSNLVGIFVAPVLVAVLMERSTGDIGGGAIETILLQLLLPFVVGHLARSMVGAFLSRHRSLLSVVDRGAILLVVYTAFSAAVVSGLWHALSLLHLAQIAGLCFALLATVLTVTDFAARRMGLPREDRIVVQFCGSKKSLVSGVPMAGVLFPAPQVGLVIVPLIIFHQLQLIVCAWLARYYAEETATVSGSEPLQERD